MELELQTRLRDLGYKPTLEWGPPKQKGGQHVIHRALSFLVLQALDDSASSETLSTAQIMQKLRLLDLAHLMTPSHLQDPSAPVARSKLLNVMSAVADKVSVRSRSRSRSRAPLKDTSNIVTAVESKPKPHVSTLDPARDRTANAIRSGKGLARTPVAPRVQSVLAEELAKDVENNNTSTTQEAVAMQPMEDTVSAPPPQTQRGRTLARTPVTVRQAVPVQQPDPIATPPARIETHPTVDIKETVTMVPPTKRSAKIPRTPIQPVQPAQTIHPLQTSPAPQPLINPSEGRNMMNRAQNQVRSGRTLARTPVTVKSIPTVTASVADKENTIQSSTTQALSVQHTVTHSEIVHKPIKKNAGGLPRTPLQTVRQDENIPPAVVTDKDKKLGLLNRSATLEQVQQLAQQLADQSNQSIPVSTESIQAEPNPLSRGRQLARTPVVPRSTSAVQQPLVQPEPINTSDEHEVEVDSRMDSALSGNGESTVLTTVTDKHAPSSVEQTSHVESTAEPQSRTPAKPARLPTRQAGEKLARTPVAIKSIAQIETVEDVSSSPSIHEPMVPLTVAPLRGEDAAFVDYYQLQRQLDKLEEEIVSSKKQLVALNQQEEQLSIQSTSVQRQLDELQTKVNQISVELKNAKLESYPSSTDGATGLTATIVDESIHLLKNRINAIQAQVKHCQKQSVVLKESMANKSDEQVDELKNQQRIKSELISAVAKEKTNMQRVQTEMQERMKQADQDAESAHAQAARKLDHLKAEHHSLQTELNRVSSDLAQGLGVPRAVTRILKRVECYIQRFYSIQSTSQLLNEW